MAQLVLVSLLLLKMMKSEERESRESFSVMVKTLSVLDVVCGCCESVVCCLLESEFRKGNDGEGMSPSWLILLNLTSQVLELDRVELL